MTHEETDYMTAMANALDVMDSTGVMEPRQAWVSVIDADRFKVGMCVSMPNLYGGRVMIVTANDGLGAVFLVPYEQSSLPDPSVIGA